MPITLSKSLRADRVGNLKLRKQLCSVPPSMSIEDVVKSMADRQTGCALVMDAEQLVGIFTERDFLARVIAPALDVSLPVRGVMTPSPKVIQQTSSIRDAIELMESGGYRHLPVMDESGKPVGVLSVKDIVHYLVQYFPANVYNLPPTPEPTQPEREGA